MRTNNRLSDRNVYQSETAALRQRIIDLEQHVAALQIDNERLRIVADFTYDWEYWVDPAGMLLYISPSCQRITGYRPTEFQADSGLLKRIIHPDDHDQMPHHLRSQQSRCPPHELHFRIITRSGEKRWISHVCQPVYNPAGEWLGMRVSNRDITDRKQDAAELQCQRQFLRQVIDSIPNLIFARDQAGYFTLVNQAMADVYGTTVDALLNKTDTDMHLDAAEVEQLRREDQQVMTTGSDLVIPERYIHDAIGQQRCFEIVKRPLFRTDGIATQVLVVATDITERKWVTDTLREKQAELQAIFDNAAVGIFLMTPDGRWLDINRCGTQMLGYTSDELTQMTYLDVIHPAERAANQHYFRTLRWHEQTSYRIERRYLRKDGTVFWGDLSVTAIHNDQGNVAAILGVLMNITWSKEAEDALQRAIAHLRQLSIRDPLTGLFNRRYLDETLPRELQRAIRQRQSIGVIMLDIDHFKQCNDTYGHDAGDTVLRTIGDFLQSHTRGADIACRYGGEEFTLVLPGATLEATRQRAEEIHTGVKRLSVSHHERRLNTVTISVGVAVFPNHGATADMLIKAADRFLYQAKRAGRDRVVVGGAGRLDDGR